MNCDKFVFIILAIFLVIAYLKFDAELNEERYNRRWEFPYESPYTTNYLPQCPTKIEQQETAPMGACLTRGALWTCSL